MGSVNAYPVRATSPEVLLVPFRLKLDGALDPTIQEGNAHIKSAVHTATGRYTITLREGFTALMGAFCQEEFATPINLRAQIRSDAIGTATGGTVVISMLQATGATPDTEAEANPPAFATTAGYLFGMLVIRDTTHAS